MVKNIEETAADGEDSNHSNLSFTDLASSTPAVFEQVSRRGFFGIAARIGAALREVTKDASLVGAAADLVARNTLESDTESHSSIDDLFHRHVSNVGDSRKTETMKLLSQLNNIAFERGKEGSSSDLTRMDKVIVSAERGLREQYSDYEHKKSHPTEYRGYQWLGDKDLRSAFGEKIPWIEILEKLSDGSLEKISMDLLAKYVPRDHLEALLPYLDLHQIKTLPDKYDLNPLELNHDVRDLINGNLSHKNQLFENSSKIISGQLKRENTAPEDKEPEDRSSSPLSHENLCDLIDLLPIFSDSDFYSALLNRDNNSTLVANIGKQNEDPKLFDRIDIILLNYYRNHDFLPQSFRALIWGGTLGKTKIPKTIEFADEIYKRLMSEDPFQKEGDSIVLKCVMQYHDMDRWSTSLDSRIAELKTLIES